MNKVRELAILLKRLQDERDAAIDEATRKIENEYKEQVDIALAKFGMTHKEFRRRYAHLVNRRAS